MTLILAGVLLLVAGCSGLGGEPRIVATVPPEMLAERAAVRLVEAPDMAAGAALFAENCIRCHGVFGAGDGDMVQSGQLPDPPQDLTDPAYVREQTPQNWFEIVTNGRLDKLMPPWRDSMSETQRWDVTLYTYTLHYSADDISAGQQLWQQTCAECHGESGTGEGETPVLTDPNTLIAFSDSAIYETLVDDTGDEPHAFMADLSEQERWSAIAYVRSLPLINTDLLTQPLEERAVVPQPPVATEEAVAAGATEAVEVAAEATEAPEQQVVGMVSGQIVSGSGGDAALAGLSVTLRILDTEGTETTMEATANDDGTFVFENVPVTRGLHYFVVTDYNGRTFTSEIAAADTANPAMELPVTVYDTTDDASVIQMTGSVMQVFPDEGVAQVAQVINFTNTSDRVFVSGEQVSDGRATSLSITLPPGASLLDFGSDRQRYRLSPDASTILDTEPVFPGANHVVHLLYEIPFTDTATFEQTWQYAINGPVQVMVPTTLSVSSEQLQAQGTQQRAGMTLQSYAANLNLPAGSQLRYQVAQAAAPIQLPANPVSLILIALGAISVVAAVALTLYGRRTAPVAPVSDQSKLVDGLVVQIAELDAAFEAGKIKKAAYQRQRQQLKTRLAALLDEKPKS